MRTVLAMPPQTPRRSRRYQPLATPSRARSDSSLQRSWSSEPLYVRPTNPDIDVLPEDQEQRDDDEEEDGTETETLFYSSFEMKNRAIRTFRDRGRSTKKQKLGEQSDITTYAIGDTVLVETDVLSLQHRPPSVGVIVAMWEVRKVNPTNWQSDPAKMRLRLHWFVRPTELPNVRANHDHTKNEIYYTLSSSQAIHPDNIISLCNVTSKAPRNKETKRTKGQTVSPSKKRGRGVYDEESSEDDNEDDETHKLYCHLATNASRGLYYAFEWENHQTTAKSLTINPPDESDSRWGDGATWDVDVAKKRTVSTARATSKPNKQRIRRLTAAEPESANESEGSDDRYDEGVESDASSESMGEESDALSAADDLPRTPSKPKRKRSLATSMSPSKRSSATKAATTTPRKSKAKTVVHPTPHSKAVLKQRQKELQKSPSKKGRKFTVRSQALNLAPLDLSYLSEDPWLRAMHVLHVGNRPDALPCREEEFDRILRCVGELLEEGSGGCVYISGVPGTGKTATVHAVVRQLKRMAENSETNPFTYVEINGLKIPEPSAAYSLLWEGVSGYDVAKHGHARIGAKESLKALTKHFSNGSSGLGPSAHACVVLMDELDQLVTTKQDVVYNFFNWPTLVNSKLVVIAVANTMDLPERVMSGRVRSRLGMIRINFQPYTTGQLQEIVQSRLQTAKGLPEGTQEALSPDAIKLAAMKVSSISGDARRVLDICRRTVELVLPKRRAAKAPDVKEVIQAMQNSPTAGYLQECSFHERVMLASLLKCVKREGVEEIKWEEVQYQHLTYVDILSSESDSSRKPTPSELGLVLDSLVASRAVLIEEGAVISRKPEGERKMLLNLEHGEVERVLGEVGGDRWRGVLSS